MIFIQIIAFLVVFGLIILVHEFGHFIVAKKSGVLVHEFALGMGPKLYSIQKGETLYSIRAFPIGGYVKMEGEDASSDNDRSFGKQPILNRFLIIVAGATMNIILGFLICIVLTVANGNYSTTVIQNVYSGFPADGILQKGDKIIAVNGKWTNTSIEIRDELSSKAEKASVITITRGNDKKEFTLTPKMTSESLKGTAFEGKLPNDVVKRYLLGIQFSENKSITNILNNSFFEGVIMCKQVFGAFVMLVSGKLGLNDVSGPVGIAKEIGWAAKAGIIYLLQLMALISINLGIFNLLPLPALDGGRLLFIAIEAVRRKPIEAEKEGFVHLVGFILLLALIVIVTGNDLFKMFHGLFGR